MPSSPPNLPESGEWQASGCSIVLTASHSITKNNSSLARWLWEREGTLAGGDLRDVEAELLHSGRAMCAE
jgi:hypothetical protein